jgi:DNA-binding transcriptional LysR family regulator
MLATCIPKTAKKATARYTSDKRSEFSISAYPYNIPHMSKRPGWELQIGRRLRMRDLHAFLTVTQCGSMAKAAEQLGISQPAISKVVADLESAFGVRLLDRGRKGVEPTSYGAALLRRSVAAFDELRQSVRDIEFLSDPARGEVKLQCHESFAATILPQLIRRFSAIYPNVVLHVDHVVTTLLALPALRSRECDLVLGRPHVPLKDEDFNVEFLFDDPMVVAAGTHNQLARRRKIDLADLIDEPWILQAPHTGNYKRLSEAFHARGLDVPKTSLVTLSMPLIVDFLANGPFITAYPRSMVVHNSLKVLPVDLPARPWPVVITTLKNRTMSPVVERFVEQVRDFTRPMRAERQTGPR